MRKVNLFIFIAFCLTACIQNTSEKVNTEASAVESDEMVLAPGKSAMRLLTDRPPNLETPLHYFLLDYTPNDVFFVRWHMSNLPPEIGTDTFRSVSYTHLTLPTSDLV